MCLETHSDNLDIVKTDKYEYYFKNRKQTNKTQKKSGGLATFIIKGISNWFHQIDSECVCVHWSRLSEILRYTLAGCIYHLKIQNILNWKF